MRGVVVPGAGPAHGEVRVNPYPGRVSALPAPAGAPGAGSAGEAVVYVGSLPAGSPPPPPPAGRYVLHAWHPDFAEQTRTVDVPAAGDAVVDFRF